MTTLSTPAVAGLLPYYRCREITDCPLRRAVCWLRRKLKRRARTAAARWAMKDLRESLRRDNAVCAYCGRYVGRRSATLDHLIPKSRGGSDDQTNLRLACRLCNQAKADRDPIQWAADILAAVQL